MTAFLGLSIVALENKVPPKTNILTWSPCAITIQGLNLIVRYPNFTLKTHTAVVFICKVCLLTATDSI